MTRHGTGCTCGDCSLPASFIWSRRADSSREIWDFFSRGIGRRSPYSPAGAARRPMSKRYSDVEVLINFGRTDYAIHEAYEHGLLGDNDLELAWRTGADSFKLAGFTNSAVTA